MFNSPSQKMPRAPMTQVTGTGGAYPGDQAPVQYADGYAPASGDTDKSGAGSAMHANQDSFNYANEHGVPMNPMLNSQWTPFLQRLKEHNVDQLSVDPYNPMTGRGNEFFGDPYRSSGEAPPPGVSTKGALAGLSSYMSGGAQPAWMQTQMLPSTTQFMQHALRGLKG